MTYDRPVVQPSPINIGGQPDPAHIVGRDAAVQAVWRTFDDGASVLLTGERRIGKSWVAKALVLAPRPQTCVVYLDVEKHSDVVGVFTALRAQLIDKLPTLAKAREKARDTGIEEIRGIPMPSNHQDALLALPALVRAAAAKAGGGVVVILDELPTLLKTMVERTGRPEPAVDLLRTLRALRHELSALRLVFAGSIGLHHVLAQDGDINDAVNEMISLPIGPLADADACLLASRLLAGINMPADPHHELPIAIARAAEGIAYYIQLTVKTIRDLGAGPATAADVQRVRDEALLAGDDPWRMQHYVTRITDYFGPDAGVAYAVLDRLAVSPQGLALDPLAARVGTHPEAGGVDPVTDRARIADVVRRLHLDHYVWRDAMGGEIRFQYELVRLGWRARRYL
jgi:hypothetical protein